MAMHMSRRALLGGIGATAFSHPATAFFAATVSAPDPFIGEDATNLGNNETGIKIRVPSVLDGSLRNCILLLAGQSNMASSFPTNYTPANATKVDNFNLYDGATYRWVDPPLGCSCGHRNGVP